MSPLLSRVFCAIAAGVAIEAHATLNFSWSGPGSIIGGNAYNVSSTASFYPNSYGDSGFVLNFFENGSYVTNTSGPAWGTATVSGTFNHPGTQNYQYRAEAFSYQGEYAQSFHTVSVQANRAPTAALSIKGVGSGGVGGVIGETVTITISGSDPDGNLRAVNLWVCTPNTSWRNIRADNSLNGGFIENTTTDNAISSGGANVGALGPQNRAFTISLNEGFGHYIFVARAIDAFGVTSASADVHVIVDNRAPAVTNVAAAPTNITFGQSTSVAMGGSDPDGNLHYGAFMVHDGTSYYRPGGVDYSRIGWNGYTAGSGWSGHNFSNDTATGATTAKTANFQPPYVATFDILAYAGDPYTNAGAWASWSGKQIVVSKATPSQSGWGSRSWIGAGAAPAGSFNVTVSNPYSGGVAAPTGALSFAVVGASGSTASPTSGGVNASTVFNPGTYTVRCYYPGDGNYNSSSWDVTFSVAKMSQTITFDALSDRSYGVASFPLSAVASSGLPVSFSVASGPASISGNTLTVTGVGTVTVTASQGGNFNYNSAASVSRSFTISKGTQSISFAPLVARTYGDAAFALSASASSGLPVTFAVASGPASISGNTLTATGAGTVTVTASQGGNANYNAAANVPQSFTVNKASQSISFAALPARTYGDPAFSLSASASSGLPVTFSVTSGPAIISGNTLTLTGGGTVTVTATQDGNANYSAASTSQSFTVHKAAQSISFSALSNRTFGVAAFSLSAAASSGLPVSFSIASGPATISGNTLTVTGAGTVAVAASQAGNSSYNAAANVIQSFTVSPANQSISFAVLPPRSYGESFDLSAMASSGLPVTYAITGPATISGNTVTVTGVGPVTVTASQSGNANYNAAPSVVQTFTATKANQTITFGALPNRAYGASPFAISATASSGLPVVFVVSSGLATISGNTVTLTGAGMVTITASQAGNGNFNAATSVSQSFAVTTESPLTPTITWPAPVAITYGTQLGGTQLNATSNVHGTFVYTPASGTQLNAGANQTLSVTFTPTDQVNYVPVTTSRSITVNKANQSPLSLVAATTQTMGVPQTLSATGGSSGGALSYAIVSSSPKATLSGAVLTPTSGTGSVQVQATRSGGQNHNNVTSSPVTINFSKATATIALGSLSQTYDGSLKTASATTTPGGLPVTLTYGTGNRVDPGSYSVTAAIAATDPNYTGSASGTLVIERASQTVSISASPSSIAFGQSVTFTATGGNNGYVWGGAASGSGASVTLSPTAAGTISVTAYSPVGGNYARSNDATGEAIVTRVIPVGTFAGKTVNGPYVLQSSDLQAAFAHPSNPALAPPTGTPTYTPAAGTALNPGTHAITASYPGDNNYAPITVTATFVVNPTTPDIIWNPAGLRYGETYGESQRGAVAKVGSQTIPGTFTYTPAPGSVATTIGSKELTVLFTPADSVNYNAAAVARTITIGKGLQTISFANPGDKRYNDFVVLTATSNSGLPVDYTVSGQAQLVAAMTNGGGDALHTNGIGSVTVTATQPGNSYYEAAPAVTHQFNVAKALHTITFPDPSSTGFALLATSSAGIPVTYSLSDTTGGWVIKDTHPLDPNHPVFKSLAFTGYQTNKTVYVTATSGNTFYETVSATSPTFSSSGPDSFWITRPANTAVAAQGYHLSFYAHHTISSDNSQLLKMYARHSSASTWTELGSGYFNAHGIVNTGVFLATPGTWEIKVVNGPDENSNDYSNHRLTITAVSGQVLNFPDPGPRKVNEVFSLGASTTAGSLPVTYHVISAAPGAVEFVTSSSIRVTQPGAVTIEARQGGGSGYAPALSVRRTFTVVSEPRLIIEQPLSYSSGTGILSAEGWALDYEDGAPIAVTLVIDGQPQGAQVVQRKNRSDIAAQAAAGNWSTKPVLNCGWEINFPVASLAEGSHTVFIRATDGSEQSIEAGHTNFVGGTPAARIEAITFNEIGPRSYGEQFMLNASALSGRLITYSVDEGAHLITLEGNRVTVKNTAGLVTIRASIPAGGGYPLASVVRSFSIAHGDEDGDGLPEWWEQSYGINATPGSDTNNDGVKDADEYHLWRNPKANGGSPKDSVPVTLTVTAKGAGTVTLNIGGTAHNFSFPGLGSEWHDPTPFGTDVHTFAQIAAKLGEETEIGVSWSGSISDFIVKSAKQPVAASELRSRVELSALGAGTAVQFADAISRSELVGANGGNKISVRATTEGSLPFGSIDTSKFEVQRRLRFGLGGSRTGDSAGMLMYGVNTYVLGGGLMNFSIIKGPAMSDIREHLSDPKRFQARVPAGYVDVYRLHDLITIRFYADDTYPDDGHFKNFSQATPLVAYTLANPMRASGSITQTTGGNSLVMEFETSYSTTPFRSDHENGAFLKQDYLATFKHWGWRKPTAPREGVTVVKTDTFQTWTVGKDNNPSSRTNQPIFVRIYRHQGPTENDGILSEERHDFGIGDLQLLYGAQNVFRGPESNLQRVSSRYSVTPSTLLSPPTIDMNSTGGQTRTDYFTSSNQLNGGSNFDGQPGFLAGERKTVRRSFLDGSPDAADAIVTNYTYKTELVDGQAAPATAITKQGTTTIGDILYNYSIPAAGQVTTQTAVQPATGAARLVTTLRAYSRRLADLDLRDKPIAITRPDGTKVAYGYRISQGELIVAELNGKTGGTITALRGTTLVEGVDMDANRSIAIERTFDKHGRLKREESFVYQGGTTFTSLGAVDQSYDDLGNLTAKTHSSGRVLYEAGYSGFRKDWEIDEQGVRLDYTYDDYNRVYTTTRASASDDSNVVAAVTTTYLYDQAGRLSKETVSATGTTETLISSYTYDSANRPKSRTLPGGFTTTIAYDTATKTTTTLPDGGTKIEEVHKDGRVKSVAGTAVPDTTTTYTYDSATGNLKTTQTTAGQWATTETDWAGRTVSVSTPTYADTTRVVSNAYNASSQLVRQQTKVGGAAIAPARVFEYDAYARLKREAVKTGITAIDPAADYDVKEYEFAYQTGAPGYSGNLYRYEGVKIWPHAGPNAATSRYASQAYTQVSGLSATTVAHAVSRDLDQNVADSTTVVDRASKKLTVSTTTSGTTATLQQVTLNGLPILSVNAQGHTITQGYDALGRLEYTRDPRIGDTDYGYFLGTTLLEYTAAPDGQLVRYTYDVAGRPKSQTNHDKKIAYFLYDTAGNLTHQWGDTVNPVKHVYNELGQKTELHTYRSGTWTGPTLPAGFNSDGDKTTWSYQATTGLLISKKDAANASTSFEYTDLAQVAKRTDARGWITLYEYTDPRKLLSKVDYTGPAATYTPDVVYAYDRSGRTTSVTDAVGLRSFAYYDEATGAGTLDGSARLKSETLPSTFGSHALTYTYQYGVANRANGALSGVKLGTGTAYNITYGYDAVLRLNSVAYNTTTAFTHTYVANSNLLDQVTQGAGGYLRDYDYRTDSNRLEKLKHAWGSDVDGQVETTVGYNSLGLRNTEKTSGTNYMTILGRSQENGVHTDYTYTDRLEVDDSGKYALLAGGAVGGLRGGTARDYDYDAIGNRIEDLSGAYTPNALNQYSAAPGVAAFSYDANGNLKADGLRAYDYDAENRLIKVTQGATVWNYKYDYLGRRIEKSGPTGTTRFLYDGWNLIAELNGSNTIQRRFAWGLDVSGSLQGAGGVGGLLVIDDGVSRRYPVYDASHNVLALYTSTGALAAAYEYDPFGNPSTVVGTYATQNPFRFSTKYTDAETGFLYYGHRYYVSALGRFLNRDPIEEAGGLNLYGFCGNDGVNRWDYLGMNSQDDAKSFAEAAGRDRANGEIIAKYGGVGFALGEGRNDQDVLNAYVDGYNGFVDKFNHSVESRGGAGISPEAGGSAGDNLPAVKVDIGELKVLGTVTGAELHTDAPNSGYTAQGRPGQTGSPDWSGYDGPVPADRGTAIAQFVPAWMFNRSAKTSIATVDGVRVVTARYATFQLKVSPNTRLSWVSNEARTSIDVRRHERGHEVIAERIAETFSSVGAGLQIQFPVGKLDDALAKNLALSMLETHMQGMWQIYSGIHHANQVAYDQMTDHSQNRAAQDARNRGLGITTYGN